MKKRRPTHEKVGPMRTAMSNETKKTGSSFMEKLLDVIVDKRNLTIILLVFSAFSRNWVEVEPDVPAV